MGRDCNSIIDDDALTGHIAATKSIDGETGAVLSSAISSESISCSAVSCSVVMTMEELYIWLLLILYVAATNCMYGYNRCRSFKRELERVNLFFTFFFTMETLIKLIGITPLIYLKVCGSVYCIPLQPDAVCRWRCALALRQGLLQCALQCVEVWCSVVQCVAACCSVLQCVVGFTPWIYLEVYLI